MITSVPRFGGRNWTVFSALLLLVPTVLAGILLKPGVSYGTLLAVAAVAGVGGGNFASSMANINAFYPQRLKGWALGVNAGGGNLGVPAVQLLGLLVLATAGAAHPRLLILVYLPLIVLVALGAALRMDNLATARGERGAMREVLGSPHGRVMSLLYIGTFGSFIGFGFAFGQVLQVQFHQQFDTPVKAVALTFLGPLLGSLARPLGGLLADRYGGARVTFWTFAAMAVGAGAVLEASREHSLVLFLGGFVALFVLSGAGNGSMCKMIPAIFRVTARAEIAEGAVPAGAERRSWRRTTALIGVAGVIGAFDGVERAGRVRGVPRLLRPVPGTDLGLLPAPVRAPPAGRVIAPPPRAGGKSTGPGEILGGIARLEGVMIVLGVILLVIGLVAGISILWTIGVVLVVIGAILWILGAAGHAVGGRRHYW